MPVPDVLGGAVEALDMVLVRENERKAELDLHVYSAWTPEAEAAAAPYARTTFHFVHTPALRAAGDRAVYWMAKSVLHKEKPSSYRYILQRLNYIERVARELAREDYDYVMLENNATLFMVMKRHGNGERYRGRVLYHLHNEITSDFGCGEQIAASRAVIGVSDFILGTLDESCPGVPKDRRVVLRNCADTSRFDAPGLAGERAAWRKRLGLADDDVAVLFSGRLTADKGILQLLEAMSRVKNPNLRLVVAGAVFFNSKVKSAFGEEVERRVKVLGDRAMMTGFVDHDKMPGLYAAADVCCMPSVWNDPAPLAVIEAMASGHPLVTTFSGGIPEYVTGECAYVLPRESDGLPARLAETLDELAGDEGLRARMGEAGRARAAEFAEGRFYKDYLDILRDLGGADA